MARPRYSDREAALRGTRRKGEAKTTPAPAFAAPAGMSPAEAAVWDRLVLYGRGIGLWRPTDILLMADICREEVLVAHLRGTVFDGDGDVEQADRLLTAAMARLMKLRAEAGLTPRSRLRMQGALERAAEAVSEATDAVSGKTEAFTVPAAFKT